MFPYDYYRKDILLSNFQINRPRLFYTLQDVSSTLSTSLLPQASPALPGCETHKEHMSSSVIHSTENIPFTTGSLELSTNTLDGATAEHNFKLSKSVLSSKGRTESDSCVAYAINKAVHAEAQQMNLIPNLNVESPLLTNTPEHKTLKTLKQNRPDPQENGPAEGKGHNGPMKDASEDQKLPSLPSCIKKLAKPTTRVMNEALRCRTCDVYVNSANQMKQHKESLRHKNIALGLPAPPKPLKEERAKMKSEQYRCTVCKVQLNSHIQMSQHLSSRRHKNVLEGKPQKARWYPYGRILPESNATSVPLINPLLPTYFVSSSSIGHKNAVETTRLRNDQSTEIYHAEYIHPHHVQLYTNETGVLMADNQEAGLTYITCPPSPMVISWPHPHKLPFTQ
uniref:C2H2-type domain-containing protein n=1 Tax=Ciona savignyi TaxID=51511 RepID=H2YEY0_CIOSA